MMVITSEEQNKVKNKKENCWGQYQRPLVPEEEEKKKGYEKIFEEIIVENFSHMEKEIVNQVQESQRVPYRINPRRNTPRHILIKLTKKV